MTIARFFFGLFFIVLSINAHAQGSGERIRFESKVRLARSQNKSILYIMGAGWCGDCRSVEETFQDPAFANVLKNYLLVTADDVWDELPYFSDSTPVSVFDQPNIYLFDPVQRRWAFVSYQFGTLPKLAEMLQLFLEGKNIGQISLARFNAGWARGEHFGFDQNDHFAIFDQVLGNLGLTASAPALAAFTRDLRERVKAHPDQLALDEGRYGLAEVLNRAYVQSYSRGIAPKSIYQAIDPLAFNQFPKSSTYFKYVMDFEVELRRMAIQQGVFFAAERCPAVAKAANALYSGTDFIDGEPIVESRAIACASLQYRVGLRNAASFQNFLAAIPATATAKLPKKLSSAYAILGQFGKAIEYSEIMRQFYLKHFAGNAPVMQWVDRSFNARKAAFEKGRYYPVDQ